MIADLAYIFAEIAHVCWINQQTPVRGYCAPMEEIIQIVQQSTVLVPGYVRSVWML